MTPNLSAAARYLFGGPDRQPPTPIEARRLKHLAEHLAPFNAAADREDLAEREALVKEKAAAPAKHAAALTKSAKDAAAASMTTKNRTAASDRPRPPAGLTRSAARKWREIADSLPADFFSVADLALLRAFVVAADQKNQIDAMLAKDALIPNGRPHPALRISRDLAASMASIAGKLRLTKASRVRPDAAELRLDLLASARPWADDDAAAEFFSADPVRRPQ